MTGPAPGSGSVPGSDSVVTAAPDLEEFVGALQHGSAIAAEVVAHMPVGTVVQAPSGEIVHGNRAAATILQLSMEQLMGRTSTDPSWRSVHPDGTPFPGTEHPAMVTLRTASRAVAHMGVRTDDGPTTWIHITSLPIRSSTGSLLGAQTFFVDVTEEFAEQDRQRRRLRRAERLAAEVNDLVVLCDATGRVTEATETGSRTLAVEPATLLGSDLGERLGAPVEMATALQECLEVPGGLARFTSTVTGPSGTARHVEVRLRNRLDDPLLESVVATLSDVDDRVAAETALRSVNQDLERRLDELDRTHRLDRLLGQTAELLAGCHRVDELADILWDLFDQAFPESPVVVRIGRGVGRPLEVTRGQRTAEEVLEPDACWAVRTRGVHSVETGGVRCGHSLPEERSICVPVLVDGRAIGSVTVAEQEWPLESLILTGERIATRVSQSIPGSVLRDAGDDAPG